MRRLIAIGLVCISCSLLGATPLGAEENPNTRELAAAKMADALRVRMEARTKRADLLAKLGRNNEALSLLESVDALYEQGMKEIRRVLGSSAAPAQPFPMPSQPFPIPVPTRPDLTTPPPPAGDTGPRLPPLSKVSTLSKRHQRKALGEAIDQGLRWLKAHQSPDGSWSPASFGWWCEGRAQRGGESNGPGKMEYQVGVTGAALLAFLVHEHTHEGRHPYAETVAKALAYLIKAQDAEGCVGTRTMDAWVYNHAFGTLALIEGYSLTRDERLLEPAKKAIAFIQHTRNPYFAWRYGVKPGDNDTSITHWMLLALHSARAVDESLAEKRKPRVFNVDTGAFQGALSWVQKVTDPGSGRVGYLQRGHGPARPNDRLDSHPADFSEAMTAAAINIRLLCGQGTNQPEVVLGGNLLLNKRPQWSVRDGVSTVDMYYWFAGALAASQLGGTTWKRWQPALLDAIVSTQRRDKQGLCGMHGSWDPAGPWGPDGGRVYATAFMLQTLAIVKAAFDE